MHAAAAQRQTEEILRFMLIAESLTKEYRSGDRALAVLRNVSFTIPRGEFVAIVGPSGSGKTTLLGLLAGLDTPSRGRVILDGDDLSMLSEDARARVRGEKVGFVFQTFQLIPTLTAIENVQVPLELRGGNAPAGRAAELLGRVGLAERIDHFPAQALWGRTTARRDRAGRLRTGRRLLFRRRTNPGIWTPREWCARVLELLTEASTVKRVRRLCSSPMISSSPRARNGIFAWRMVS